jgi:hypothetical protein
MAHVITFTTDRFDISAEKPNPINPIAGQSALLWLRAELVKAGYRVTEPDTEDWGWYMDAEGPSGAYMVGASADAENPASPAEWTLQVHRHRSIKDKVLGRNQLADADPLVGLIEKLVRAETRIQDVLVTRE